MLYEGDGEVVTEHSKLWHVGHYNPHLSIDESSTRMNPLWPHSSGPYVARLWPSTGPSVYITECAAQVQQEREAIASRLRRAYEQRHGHSPYGQAGRVADYFTPSVLQPVSKAECLVTEEAQPQVIESLRFDEPAIPAAAEDVKSQPKEVSSPDSPGSAQPDSGCRSPASGVLSASGRVDRLAEASSPQLPQVITLPTGTEPCGADSTTSLGAKAECAVKSHRESSVACDSCARLREYKTGASRKSSSAEQKDTRPTTHECGVGTSDLVGEAESSFGSRLPASCPVPSAAQCAASSERMLAEVVQLLHDKLLSAVQHVGVQDRLVYELRRGASAAPTTDPTIQAPDDYPTAAGVAGGPSACRDGGPGGECPHNFRSSAHKRADDGLDSNSKVELALHLYTLQRQVQLLATYADHTSRAMQQSAEETKRVQQAAQRDLQRQCKQKQRICVEVVKGYEDAPIPYKKPPRAATPKSNPRKHASRRHRSRKKRAPSTSSFSSNSSSASGSILTSSTSATSSSLTSSSRWSSSRTERSETSLVTSESGIRSSTRFSDESIRSATSSTVSYSAAFESASASMLVD